MRTIAVIAHRRKELGGGLAELRSALRDRGVRKPAWFEVDKSKRAPAAVRRAVEQGAKLLFVWGGDGMVQRCVDAAARSQVTIAIVPAGTANLLATNLGIEHDLAAAVETGLHGRDRRLDLGVMNGEHFAVMAGAGFDAAMLDDIPRAMKERLGRIAYVVSGARHLSAPGFRARVRIDGDPWFDDLATCVLVGNVPRIFGGVTVFPAAEPDDGLLDIAIVTAQGAWEWGRAFARTMVGDAARSPFVETTTGRRIEVRLDKAIPYELDGGARRSTKRLRIGVRPSAVTIRVPEFEAASAVGTGAGARP